MTLLPASEAKWVWLLVGIPLFFWSGLRPLGLWTHRPRPVWLFFLLWMVVPFVLIILVSAALRAIGLYDQPCCG